MDVDEFGTIVNASDSSNYTALTVQLMWKYLHNKTRFL